MISTSPEKQRHCVWVQHGLGFCETWRGGIEFTAIQTFGTCRDPVLNTVREDSLSNGTLLPLLPFSAQLGETTVPVSSCCRVMQPVHGTLAPADIRTRSMFCELCWVESSEMSPMCVLMTCQAPAATCTGRQTPERWTSSCCQKFVEASCKGLQI